MMLYWSEGIQKVLRYVQCIACIHKLSQFFLCRLQLCFLSEQIIKALEIDVWRKEIDELELDIKLLKYPPCFCVLAKTNSKFFRLHLQTSEGHHFDISMLCISLDSDSSRKCHINVVTYLHT